MLVYLGPIHRSKYRTLFLDFIQFALQESAWELPLSCTTVGTEEAGSPTAPVPAFADEASPSCWIEVLDESTNKTFFYNTTTQVSKAPPVHAYGEGARAWSFEMITFFGLLNG